MHACLARSSRLFKVDRRCPPLLRLAQKRLTLLRGFGPHIGSAVRPVGRRPHLTLSYRNCRWLAPSSSTADGAMRAQQLCRACRDSRPTSSSRCSRCLVPSLFPRPIDRHPFAISSMPIMNCGLSHVHTTIGSLFSRRVSTLRPSCNLTPACLVVSALRTSTMLASSRACFSPFSPSSSQSRCVTVPEFSNGMRESIHSHHHSQSWERLLGWFLACVHRIAF